MSDFITIDNGSIVVVEARTPEAEARLEEIIVENKIESYLRVGPHGVAVEHRYAGLWTENLQSEGFTVDEAPVFLGRGFGGGLVPEFEP